MKKNLLLFFLFLTIGYWLSETNQRTDYWCRDQHFEEYQEGVMNHTITGPIAYRVMVPYAVDFLSSITNPGNEKIVVFYLNILVLILTQFAFFYYLRNFFSDMISLAGTLLLDLGILMSFTSFIGVHVYETADALNIFFMVCALHLLYNRKMPLLILVLFVSMFNRESPAFLLVTVYALVFRKELSFRHALACTMAVIVPYLGLKLLIHPPQPSWFLTVYLTENLPFVKGADMQAIGEGFMKFVLVIGFALTMALIDFRKKNSFLKMNMLIVLVYVPVHLVVGHLEEFRLWVMLFIILIPLGLETLRNHLELQ